MAWGLSAAFRSRFNYAKGFSFFFAEDLRSCGPDRRLQPLAPRSYVTSRAGTPGRKSAGPARL